MKKTILITTSLLLVACGHDTPPAAAPTPSAHADLPVTPARRGQYIAMPGQAVIDTDAAFEQQVAAYANGGVQPTPAAGELTRPMQAPAIPSPAEAATIAMPTQQPTTPAFTDAVNGMGAAATAALGSTMDSATGMVQPTPTQQPTPAGLVDYTLRITNATSGRIFVEAQDAAGEIYPCGFMAGSQSVDSEKTQVSPIKGPITVVIRDPDKPDAPELRRYKVDPPTGYAGKTVEITIISGGYYQVSVDGQVRYITPTPVPRSPQPAAPAPAAAPEAPAAPATPAAPAPEATPAGI